MSHMHAGRQRGHNPKVPSVDAAASAAPTLTCMLSQHSALMR